MIKLINILKEAIKLNPVSRSLTFVPFEGSGTMASTIGKIKSPYGESNAQFLAEGQMKIFYGISNISDIYEVVINSYDASELEELIKTDEHVKYLLKYTTNLFGGYYIATNEDDDDRYGGYRLEIYIDPKYVKVANS